MAEVGQRGRRRQAHVAGADHGDGVALRRLCVGGAAHAGANSARSAGTRRASPSCQSRQRGQPAQAQRHVVEHRVGRAGRQEGRVDLVGPDRQDTLGVGPGLGQDRPHEAPPGRGAAVGGVEDPGPPVETERHDGGRQIGGERRRPVLVVDEAQRRRRPPARRSAVRDDVVAVGPAQPARPDDGRAGPALALTGQLGGAVDRRRVRGVPLPVGAVGRAVEDVVGRHVDDVRAHQRGGLGDVAGADGIHGVGRVDLGLAAFDRGERAAVQDELGAERA